MLEVKNLRKKYLTKKGVITNALDGVSLTFPERGMVFILGKSGSGKSTLLNVCGGLDKCTSGEIVIKGKSSADFSPSDFDSYRNTYVGFVFQEYNILEDFTVEENIALALELQSKKPDKAVINKILADVDMTNFASRKPNTLSGGQKQRVAIARALVKEPQIIMADEPTGALDSKTGQQVFDTLKRLSADKLVLVVSHDRDFAEQYADRIIELKDGKVISDMVRNAQAAADSNVTFLGGDTVCVKNGGNVTDEDIESIKKFLSKSNGRATITTNRDKALASKPDAVEIAAGEFEDIKEQPESKQYGEQKLIRSKLPLRHAVKMGASGLKTKPVRLAFTILLSIVAFVLFGLASTLMLFDEKQVTTQTLADTDYDYIILSKAYYNTSNYYNNGELTLSFHNKDRTNYSYDEYLQMRQKYPDTLASVEIDITLSNFSADSPADSFYSIGLDGCIISDDSMQILAGRLPQTTDEVAITDFVFDAIKSSKTSFWYYSGGSKVEVNPSDGEYQKVIYSDDNPVYIRWNNGQEFKIVGVVKGSDVPSEYAEMKKAADQGGFYTADPAIKYQWIRERTYGMFARLVVTKEFVEKYRIIGRGATYIYSTDNYFDQCDESRLLYYGYESAIPPIYTAPEIANMAKYDKETGLQLLDVYDFGGNRVTSLAPNEIAVGVCALAKIYDCNYSNYRQINDEYYNKEEKARLDEIAERAEAEFKANTNYPNIEDYDDIQEYYYASNQWYSMWHDECIKYVAEQRLEANKMKGALLYIQELKDEATRVYKEAHPMPDPSSAEYNNWLENLNSYVNKMVDNTHPIYRAENIKYCTNEEAVALIIDLREFLSRVGVTTDMVIRGKGTGSEMQYRNAVVAGIFYEDMQDSAYLGAELYDTFFVPQNYYERIVTKYNIDTLAYISSLLIPYNANRDIAGQIVSLYYDHNADDSSAIILNPVMDQLDMLIELAQTLSTAFLIAGLSLAAFAFLLMFNFISASITAKKKEIGILRAIGARTADVFKIFLAEACIIALICFVVATAATAGLCALLNSTLTADTIINVSIFVFGPLSVLCIFAIAAVTAVVSTVIPVALYSRKPPVESIRAL